MLTKIYAALWFTVVFAAGILFLAGNFTMLTAVVFGFITLGLVFAGMMCVLPVSVAHPTANVQVPSQEQQVIREPISVLQRPRTFMAEWLTPNGVEIRKPKFH